MVPFLFSSVFSHLIVIVLAALALWLVLGLVFRRQDGAKWLRRWGLDRPATADEARSAARRIRVQRGWLLVGLVAAWVLLGPLLSLVGVQDGSSLELSLLVALLLGLLLGELVTVLGQRGRPVRTASLVPRPATRLVAGWARWGLRVGTVLVLALVGVVGLQARWWATAPTALVERSARNSSANVGMDARPAGALAVVLGAVLVLVIVETVVHLAVTRPSREAVSDDVDLLMRTRSARVATGAGLGLTSFLVAAVLGWSHARIETLRGVTNLDQVVTVWANASGIGPLLVPLLGILAWIYAANPPARSVLRTERPTPVRA